MVCMCDERLQHVFTCFVTLNGQFPVFRPHAFHGITAVLFAVSCLHCVFLFPVFLAGMFMKHAVSFIRDKVVSCVILTKYHLTCFIVHCSRLQCCLHM